MFPSLTEQQRARYAEFKCFVAEHVEPVAEQCEREQSLPRQLLAAMAAAGYLGATLPRDLGGAGWDTVTFGLLNEAFGRGSSSLTSVLTVQAMVSMALMKWGTKDQKAKWIPRLASGDVIAAFALTEPGAGSALEALTTTYTRRARSDSLVLNGAKRWITCAQIAGIFLIFGMLDHQPVAALVPRDRPGLRIEPIQELMGFRAAGLAKLTFNDVEVPMTNVIGRPGFGFSHVAPIGLHYGRISTACSALGLLRGCFEQSVTYAGQRKIGDQTLGELGMIRTLIATMGTDLQAAALLCLDACRQDDEHATAAFESAFIAKYFTSRAAVRAASDAVQIRGASGCHESSATSRYYRCSKIMEIIEGTTQIHEDMLGKIFIARGTALEEMNEGS